MESLAGQRGQRPMNDERSLKEKFEEASELNRQGQQDREDAVLMRKVQLALQDTVPEQVARLLSPDVEGNLRRKFHLERPVDLPTSSQSDEDRLRQIRQRLRNCQ